MEASQKRFVTSCEGMGYVMCTSRPEKQMRNIEIGTLVVSDITCDVVSDITCDCSKYVYSKTFHHLG